METNMTTTEQTYPPTTTWYETTTRGGDANYDTTEYIEYHPWPNNYTWEINHIIIIMAFIAVNVIPITLGVWCLTKNCKRYSNTITTVYMAN